MTRQNPAREMAATKSLHMTGPKENNTLRLDALKGGR